MRYVISFIFISLTFLLSYIPIHAEWIKYPINPILKAIPGTWYGIHTASPSVINDNGTYKMWFQGYSGSMWQIGYAESDNGINWTVSAQPQIDSNNPYLQGVGEIVEPMVIKNGTLYQMWFKDYISGENRIRYATSNNGTLWTVNSLPIFTKTNGLPWESSGPTNPAVIFDDGVYKMWYISNGPGMPWKLGYATSTDGIVWTRYGNNPLVIPSLGFVGGPTVIKRNGQYHMWYHTGSNQNTDIYHVVSSDGISWSCDNSCSVLHIQGGSFDSFGMTAPTVIEQGGKLLLWYGGFNGTNWQIGLATFDLPVTLTPTPTSAPTPIPTSTPTPVLEKKPIVIIPGLFASWNKQAILHNKQVFQSDWKLAPFVEEYNGVIATLENLGYEIDKNLFIFPYDWRSHVSKSAIDLKDFLDQKIFNQDPSKKINIIGHSLGGLVARTYAQLYGGEHINRLLIIGSPNKGTAHVYRAIEAGEIERTSNFLWLAEKTIVMLNKDSFETDRDTLNTKFPVLHDLFPIYNFLKLKNSFLSVESMSITNNFLKNLNLSATAIYPILYSMDGAKGDTLYGFDVSERTTLDRLLHLYDDGRPINDLNEIGDYVINVGSARIGNNIVSLPNDHGEIVFKNDSISTILNTLKIPYQDRQIIESRGTQITPSLIFFIKSPAEMEVQYKTQIYKENDGIIFIPNPRYGTYTLRVKGVEAGRYTVIIAQNGINNDIWSTIEGEIEGGAEQVDTYPFYFNLMDPSDPIVKPKVLFQELILYLRDIHNDSLNRIIQDLQKTEHDVDIGSKKNIKNEFLFIHKELFHLFHLTTDSNFRNKLLYAIDKFEYLYKVSLAFFDTKLSPDKEKFRIYQNQFEKVQDYLLLNNGDIEKYSTILYSINNKMKLAKENLASKPVYTEILLYSIHELLQGLPKI